MIKEYEKRGRFQGTKIAKNAHAVSHMLFDDDSYLYCKANGEGARSVMKVLQYFQDASGQQVNLDKSSIFFSPNTDANIRREICSIMRINEAGDESTYLGLPSTLGRNKSVILDYLKERMR